MIDQRGASTSLPLPAFRSKLDAIRSTYGFEDVSLAPGTSTIEPNDVELGQSFCGLDLAIPVLASAMDAVVDPAFAGALARLGGLAVLNLEGVQTRYDDPSAILGEIAAASDEAVQEALTRAYAAPIRDDLVARRLDEIHAAGSKAVVSATPGSGASLGTVLRRARCGPLPRPVAGLIGPPPGVGLRPAVAGRIHEVHADPRGRRKHDER